jgi:TRAP-type uncharacterized transport system substrate-binding protein
VKPKPAFGNRVDTLWYRIKRYPVAALISLGLALIMTILLCYLVGRIFPDFKLFNDLSSKIGIAHDIQYSFYSGEKGGAYYAIGEAIEGRFEDDGDSIKNYGTAGGYDNAMKVTIEGNSFGLIQQEMIRDNDQLRNEVRIIAPIFLERMHILYRKELLKKFVNGDGVLQLSLNMPLSFLRQFNNTIRHVSVGPVGSASQILSSYVLQFIDKQVNDHLQKVPKYRQTDEPFDSAFASMQQGKGSGFNAVIDMMFYVGAAPIDEIENLLDKGKYALMSISPSFVAALNKDFDLNLRVSDFKNKYDPLVTQDVSTIGTLAYLITSKATPDDDVLKMLKRIDTSRIRIHRSLITLVGKDTVCYRIPGDYVLPLCEFGFFKTFENDYEASRKIKGRELLTFLLSAIGLFFPALKSVNGMGSVWKAWNCNRQIDRVARLLDNDHVSKKEGETTEPGIRDSLSALKARIIDLYGDGSLLETHYDRLMQRIAMYLEKISLKPGKPGLEITLGKTG